MKQKLSASLGLLTVCACGLALLFTSGCSDKTPPPAAAMPANRTGQTSPPDANIDPGRGRGVLREEVPEEDHRRETEERIRRPRPVYSAIAVQLGIAEIAWEAAASKFEWKKDDGKVTKSMVKGGPTAAGGQGTWDVMFIRFAVNPETKKPDPATMESKMVQLDYDGNIKFPEIPKQNR